MIKNDFEKYYLAIKYLEGISNITKKNYVLKKDDRSFFINRLRYLLKLLNNPHRGFRFIHVAGTAGKGSTVNMIHEILTAAGHKVGSYFSPHPTTSIERIKVNDHFIAPNDFAKLIESIKPALKQCVLKGPDGHPSYFEVFLALAFLYFKKTRCQYVILEAGLGGRHDATNIIEKPLLNIITNIHYDHQDVLGGSLKEIASDKAGIIKPGATVITAEARLPLIKIFRQTCRRVKAEFIQLKTAGPDSNRALAQQAAIILKIKERFIAQGLKRAKLPCRFEIIQAKPLTILDGAHNPVKMSMVAKNLSRLKYQKLILLLGMAANKDHQKTLSAIAPLADQIILTRFLNPNRKTADLRKLQQICAKYKIPVKVFLDPWQALAFGQKIQQAGDCLLITGSFFLTGELRTNWVTENEILNKRI